MGKTPQQQVAALSPKRRKRIADRVVKMIAEGRAGRARRLARLVTEHVVKPSDVKLTPRPTQASTGRRKSQYKPGGKRSKRDR